MLLVIDIHKMRLMTKNLRKVLHNSISAFKPNIRAKPAIGSSLLNLGSIILGEKIKPPLITVDSKATTANNTMMGKIITKPSMIDWKNIAGSSSALSITLRSNCNWLVNKAPSR